jgi:hypothetical protein
MCILHNGLLRGLNSIYLQAPHITKPSDQRDFIEYALLRATVLESHHEGEEINLFLLWRRL